MTFARYVGIQLLAYVIDMGAFLLILEFDIFGAIIANITGKCAAGIFAFVAHRNFTFYANHSADRMRQAGRYIAVLALNVPISTGVLGAFLMWINEPAIAKVAADFVVVALSYMLSKHFIFAKQPIINR